MPYSNPLSETVVVLDLDDTLYHEKDYQQSGFNEVVSCINQIYGKNLETFLAKTLKNNLDDILLALCKEACLPSDVKQSLLWIYRLHTPRISLDNIVFQVILELRKKAAGLAILTDGRSVTQRLKLKSLGLSDIPAYISEEYGDEKPSSIRYQAIMKDIPARHYIYIADNPAKDFFAPNKLGWLTIGVSAGPQNIHSQLLESLPEDYWPSVWVSKLSDFFLSQKC